MHLLPTGHVFYSASSSATVDFDPSTSTWKLVAWTIYPGQNDPNGERTYGTSVLLPLTPENNYSPKVMIMGGDNPATNTTELIDLSPAGAQISAACPIYAPCWVPGPNMVQARVEMEATILPNGKVLVDGGSAHDEEASTASLKAEIYDPATNSFSSAGSNAFPRLYHNVQLLLPDGTVAITGGNPEQGVFENHIEIYQPAYLFNSDGTLATRPTIGTGTPDFDHLRRIVQRAHSGCIHHRIGRPDEARFGHPFVRHGPALCRVDASPPASGSLTVSGPPNSNIAPPGYYMLFLVNKSGTPSIASWVQVSGPAAPIANVQFHPERIPTPRYIVQRKHVTESQAADAQQRRAHALRATEK